MVSHGEGCDGSRYGYMYPSFNGEHVKPLHASERVDAPDVSNEQTHEDIEQVKSENAPEE